MAERRSDKHAPRLDEQLQGEDASLVRGAPVEARTDEHREKEGPANGEPTPDSRLAGDRGLTPDGALPPDAANARADLARHLEGIAFPAGRDALVARARDAHAAADIIDELTRLPGDRRFDNVQDVWEALGGQTEHRG